jgi:hypothetical protein
MLASVHKVVSLTKEEGSPTNELIIKVKYLPL